MRFVTTSVQRTIFAIVIASLLILGVRPLIFPAQAADLLSRSVKIGSPLASDTTDYTFAFDIATASPLGSIRIEFCSNSPLEVEPCTAPSGFDVSAGTLVSQSGETGFSIAAGSPSNEILLTRTVTVAVPGPSVYEVTGIVNPDTPGPYFVRIATYASEDGTGSRTDFGGLAYEITDQTVQVSTTVPPYLLFCVGVTIIGFDCNNASGSYVNFGELSSTTARTGSTQMLTATNAASGFAITVSGTTLLSGTNSIPALTTNDVSRPGTGQFGINLRNNTDPDVGTNPIGSGSGAVSANYNIVNRYRFISGEQLASATNSDEYRKFTVSYVVNVAKGQAPGIYVSTLTYICIANF